MDEKFRIDEESGCWLWLGTRSRKNRGGYAIAYKGGHSVVAHRVYWEMENGPIPDGMNVLHSCPNKACVNPAHLFLANKGVNMGIRHKGKPAVRYDILSRTRIMYQRGIAIPEEEVYLHRDATPAMKEAVCELCAYKPDRFPITTLTKDQANQILREYGYESWTEVGAL